jgi:tetratricopeptide (TPR) repeat protein
MATRRGDNKAAAGHFETAIALLTEQQRSHPAARVSARLGETMWNLGELEGAVERMAASYSVLASEEGDADLAMLAAQLGRFEFFVGRTEAAALHLEAALEIAERLRIAEVLSMALNTKSLIKGMQGHPAEAIALLKHSLDIALEGGASGAALRAYYNLSDRYIRFDRMEDALATEERGLVLARQRGDHYWEWLLASQRVYPLYVLGRWREALELAAELADPDRGARRRMMMVSHVLPGLIHTQQGRPEAARRLLGEAEELRDSADVQDRAAYAAVTAAVLRSEGRHAEALAAGEQAFDSVAQLGPGESVQEGHVEAVDAALALGDLASAERLIARALDLRPIDRTRYHSTHLARFQARIAAQRHLPDDAEAGFRRAVAGFRELGAPFGAAVSLLEYAEWLTEERRADEVAALLRDARGIFEELEAAPWLRRLGHAELAAGITAARPHAAAVEPDPAALRVQALAD